ncbi:MAG: metal ABC transporter solute-binding protein, Zn/Mn family [Microthrixaceae bacterium]
MLLPTPRPSLGGVRWTAGAAAAALAILLPACGDAGGPAAAASSVMATTSIWADVTSQITCGEVEVTSLIPRGSDAHAFEPSVQDADALRSAQLVVANGLGLEEGLHDVLGTAAADGVTVLEVGPSLDPLAADGHGAEGHVEEGGVEESGVEEGGDHDHGEDDPHVWMDPDRVAAAVPLIAAALAEVDGLELPADRLDRCAAEYADELRELGTTMDTTLSVVAEPRRRLVTDHEALGYFADRFDFTVVGAAIPSTSSLAESDPRGLEELAATMRAEGVPAVFTSTTGPTQLADALAAQVGSGVRVVQLSTESLGAPGTATATYVEMLRTDAELVADALGAGEPGTGADGAGS